jgi:hypothetical protein
MNKTCFAQVARKLVHGITADIAQVQMIVDLQLLIQIQLLVDELHKPPKAACAHSTSGSPNYENITYGVRCASVPYRSPMWSKLLNSLPIQMPFEDPRKSVAIRVLKTNPRASTSVRQA